jgi:hypothetical protein
MGAFQKAVPLVNQALQQQVPAAQQVAQQGVPTMFGSSGSNNPFGAVGQGLAGAAQLGFQNLAGQQPQTAQMGTQNLAGQPALSPAAQQAAQGAWQAISGGKGGQPPTPQQLGQGLQQQAAMSNAIQSAAGSQTPTGTQAPSAKGGQPPAGQIPMSMQRQPQGGMAGRTPQRGLGGRSMGSFVGSRRY